MSRLGGTLFLQYEFETPEGMVWYSVWPWAEESIKEMQGSIKRVLLRNWTKRDSDFLDMRIKQDMSWAYLQQDMDGNVLTSHEN